MNPFRPKAVLIDLAGVLHVGDAAIPGAVDALAQLREAGMPLRFLTNTTRSPRQRLVRQLQTMGFRLSPDEVFTAPQAAKRIVEQRGLRPYYLIHPDLEPEMGPSADEPDAVVLGDAGDSFTFAHLNRAFRYLMQDLPLIAMAKNRYFKEADGLTLDMGAFVAALEYSAGVQAEVVGKPSAAYFNTALFEFGVEAEEAVMIGDDVCDDIGGAQKAGIRGILVRTGKFRSGDDRRPDVEPYAVHEDFGAAVRAVLQS